MTDTKIQTTEELIDKLEIYRLEKKISQQKLAETLGVTYVTVNHWLNKKSKPNKIQTYQIKKLLNGQIKEN
jgi:DNA-binding transcriptional regulator YiaG